MTQERIGKYTINHEPALEFATVTADGLLTREVVYRAEGPDAVEQCRAWIATQQQ